MIIQKRGEKMKIYLKHLNFDFKRILFDRQQIINTKN